MSRLGKAAMYTGAACVGMALAWQPTPREVYTASEMVPVYLPDEWVYQRISYCCEDSLSANKFYRLGFEPDSTWIYTDTLHPQGWDTRR